MITVDPDELLATIRGIVGELLEVTMPAQYVVAADLGQDLAEYVQALDVWLTRGGFLPEGWKAAGT